MRKLIACLLAASAAVPALAQSEDRVFVVPRGIFTLNAMECGIAMVAARDHAGEDIAAPWPTLWVEEGDRRWPLDCEATFRAMGAPDHRLMRGGEALNISRPVFTSETTATLLVDASLGMTFISRTRYTLELEDGQWRVTGRVEEPVTGGVAEMT